MQNLIAQCDTLLPKLTWTHKKPASSNQNTARRNQEYTAQLRIHNSRVAQIYMVLPNRPQPEISQQYLKQEYLALVKSKITGKIIRERWSNAKCCHLFEELRKNT